MDIKEKLNAIKVLLGMAAAPAAGAKEPAGTVETESAKATTTDGTMVKWDGDLAMGTAITVITPEGDKPAPDGALEFEDGTVIEVAGGVCTKVTAAAMPPAPAEGQGMWAHKFKTHEDVNAMILSFADGTIDQKVTALAQIVKFMFDEQFGWMIKNKERENQMNTVSSLVTTLQKQLSDTEQAHKAEIASVKEAFTKTVEIVELMNHTPIEQTPAPIDAKFKRQQEDEERIAKITEAIRLASKS